MSLARSERVSNVQVRSVRRHLPEARPWQFDALAILLLLGLTALISWDRLRYDEWLGRTDLLAAYIPAYSFLGQELRNFNIPAWSPFQASGLPFAGDPQSGWMYLPVMFFYSFLSPIAATKAIVVFNLALASVSTYAFARVVGLRTVGSLVAAVSFTFGATVYQSTWCCTIWSQLSPWLPLGFLGIELALRKERWIGRGAGWCMTAFAVSQMMAGWMGQGIYNAALLLGAYLAYRALLSPPGGSPVIRDRFKLAVITGGAILVLSLGLSAAGLLPRLEANRSTQLAGGNYAEIESGDGTGWLPVVMFHHLLDTSDRNASRQYYIGGITFGLAVLALFVARRRNAVPFFAAMAIAIPVIALPNSPLEPLYGLLPRYQELHEHSQFRVFGLFFLAPAMLAGAAANALVPWLGRRWSALIALLPGPLVFAASRYVESRYGAIDDDPTIGDDALRGAIAVSVLVLAGIAIYHLGRRWRMPWTQTLLQGLPVLMLLALLWEPTGRQLTEGGVISRQTPPARQAAIAANLSETDVGGAGEFIRQQLAAPGEPFRYFGYDAAGLRTEEFGGGELYHERRIEPRYYSLLVGARATRLQIYDAQGYNPIQSSLYAEYLIALNGGVAQDYHDANILTSGFDSPLLNLLNIRYIVVPRDIPPGRPDLLRLNQLHPTVFMNEQVRVFENRNALPHAWITHGVQEADHDEMLPILDSAQIDPRQITLVEPGETPELPMEAAGGEDRVTVTQYEPDSITLETQSQGNGMLVVSEVFTPGWTASIDGESVSIQEVNYLFRGIPLPAGEHTVEFRFEPAGLTAGLIATSGTAAGMLVFVVVAGVLGWRRRQSGALPV